MSKNFMSAVKGTLNSEYNTSVTENGAVGYRTSGKELLDINFAVASLRRAEPREIYDRFMRAFFEDKVTAMKWLFFARDVRGGLGERRLFRSVFERMAQSNPEYIIPLINLVPEYGRYDDLWSLLDTELAGKVMDLVKKQLEADVRAASKGDSISLLAKWLPSPNASSPKTKRYAKMIFKHIGISERDYRKTLSRLRKKLDVVERKMSARTWDKIKYEAVPSRANLIYNAAFLRNDEERRREFLASLEKGEAKINAGTLYPHDIVSKYTDGSSWKQSIKPLDKTLEALWKALPDTVQGCGNTIVVADGSGSMTTNVGGTSTTALDVANALAIYFAERSSGQFKDQYITFSEQPQLVNLSKGKNLREKIQIALGHSEVANTNIEAVFDLILSTAIANHMTQEDLPKNILIISDMEFDSCATCGMSYNRNRYSYGRSRPDAKLFQVIAKKYADAGYQIPRMVFWNVNSRTGTIPVIENDLGVALVSGFSTNIVKMVMSGKTDPYECLLETLNSERYAPIGEALSYL
ncbi:MAG: DUF2828 domain-containing protein [Lachnospiraceae bacterium]|nr:DUF2828 domain-containing protein [Lachnospiraceae bacterium]